MIKKVAEKIKEMLSGFSSKGSLAEDCLIFNNKVLPVLPNSFTPICPEAGKKITAFVDGGQAEILTAGNFSLSFIRVAALLFNGSKKVNSLKKEFFLLTTARYMNNDLFYDSKIFGDKLIELVDESDLLISSADGTIRVGTERAPIGKVSNIARRFAELSFASSINADFIVLDGTLQPTFKNEKKYLDKLKENACALAKSSSLFTTSGDSPVVLLNRIGPQSTWSYFIDDKSYFVKLHEKAKHVFRFEGNSDALHFLAGNSSDALFLGYPYGLIAVDRLARVSDEEKKSLRMQFLLDKENKEIVQYLNTSNAHDILDNLG